MREIFYVEDCGAGRDQFSAIVNYGKIYITWKCCAGILRIVHGEYIHFLTEIFLQCKINFIDFTHPTLCLIAKAVS